jgi:phosphonate transport system permease protein
MGGGETWERFTPRERMARFAIYLGVVAAVVWSLRTIEIIPEFLADAPTVTYYPQGIHEALVETVHIATLGTLATMLMAIPVGLMAARNVTRSKLLNWLAQVILVSTRSVNTLVWAILFVAIFGPGALAGTAAIAFRSIGFVGKLFAEAMEDAHPGPIEALGAAGAPKTSVLMFGFWPQVKPAFWSIMLFRWDINVRESAILGLVGAGGIGVVLEDAMNLFQWHRVAAILLSIFAVVILAEIVVAQIRKRII